MNSCRRIAPRQLFQVLKLPVLSAYTSAILHIVSIINMQKSLNGLDFLHIGLYNNMQKGQGSYANI